jgi:hypothetical protein
MKYPNATPRPWRYTTEDVGDEEVCRVPLEIYGADEFRVVANEGGLADANGFWNQETLHDNAQLIVDAVNAYVPHKAEAAPSGEGRRDEEAAMLLRMACAKLRKWGELSFHAKVVDWLKRNGLEGSPLRAESALRGEVEEK